MSRKTRKLIWSVPLVAVLAVAGALAIFAVLAPNGAQAQEVMVPGPATGLEATAKSRSSIELNWVAPTTSSGGAPTGYRIDHSSDNRAWTRLVEKTTGTATRYPISTGVKSDTERYYRVFAINEAGTGPVSVEPVTAFASVPVAFPPVKPSRVTLTLGRDAKDPTGKINLSWTEPTDNGGSALLSYKIVEMIDEDGVGSTPRMECASQLQGSGVNVSITWLADATAVDQDNERHCLLIDAQDAADDRMAMHSDLTAGSAHSYRVTATNVVSGGLPSDTKSITTQAARAPDAPTKPIAVPLENSNIELYWLEPANDGGVDLGPHILEVQGRVRNVAGTAWLPWTGWVRFKTDDTNVTVGGETISITPAVPPTTFASVTVGSDGSLDENDDGIAYNLELSLSSVDGGEYKFQIRAKQGGAETGLDLESRWVSFNQAPHAGLGYITVPAPAVADTRIPLMPTLTAKALDAEVVKDQGIGLTWKPAGAGTEDTTDDGPTPVDYRIDMSKDGLKWARGQTSTVSLSKWDHDGLKPDDVRYYRLFPINGGRFGQADNAAAQAEKAEIASPDQVLNLRQTDATTTSITMSWNSVPGAETYDLYSAAVDEVTGNPVAFTELKFGLTTTTYTDEENLIPGAFRWYRVIALDDATPAVAVPGADGAEALGEADDAGAPGTPVGLVAQQAFDSRLTNNDDRGVLLLWAQPEDKGKDPTTSYTVEWKSDTMTSDLWETLVTDTSNLEDQTPESTHYHHDVELGTDEQRAYQVRALSGSGAGVASNVAYYPPMAGMAVADDLGAPSLPRPRVVTVGGIKTISILWDSGEGEERQIVQLLTEDRMFVDSQTVMPDVEGADFDNNGAGIVPGTYRVQIVGLGMGTDFRNSGTVVVEVE